MKGLTKRRSAADKKFDEALDSAGWDLHPVNRSALVIADYLGVESGSKKGVESRGALCVKLAEQAFSVAAGDLTRAEHMLIAQAHALDVMFGDLARKSRRCQHAAEHLDMFMRLALRSQSQCRATIETLALMKNPSPVAFVRQANIGQAVQVNNGQAVPDTRAAEGKIAHSKVMGITHVPRLDPSASPAPIAADSPVEAVEECDRPENPRGSRHRQPKRLQGRDPQRLERDGQSAQGAAEGRARAIRNDRGRAVRHGRSSPSA